MEMEKEALIKPFRLLLFSHSTPFHMVIPLLELWPRNVAAIAGRCPGVLVMSVSIILLARSISRARASRLS